MTAGGDLSIFQLVEVVSTVYSKNRLTKESWLT